MRCPVCQTEAARAPSWADRWHVRGLAVLACSLGVVACLVLNLPAAWLVAGLLGLVLLAQWVQSFSGLRFHRCTRCQHEFPVAD